MSALAYLGRLWEEAAGEAWNYAAKIPADERERVEVLLVEAATAWREGAAEWDALRAEQPILTPFSHEAAPILIAWLRGFLDGLKRLEATTHRQASPHLH